MSRPVTGTRGVTTTGRFTFRCLTAPGSGRYRTASFATEAEREHYADIALEALRTGLPVPPPPGPARPEAAAAAEAVAQRQPAPSPTRALSGTWQGPTDIATVARRFFDAHYVVGRRAGAGRALAVQTALDKVIVPYFRERVGCVTAITHDLVLEFVRDFQHPAAATSIAPPATGDRLTVAEVAAATGRSVATVKRAIASGALSAEHDPDRRCRVVRAEDLLRAGLLGKQARARSVGYTRNQLDVLQRLLHYAHANGLPVLLHAADNVRLPDRRERSAQQPLSLTQCRDLAQHLHPVWQLPFWLMRLLGLRISEAFGLRVEDVLDFGDGGTLDIHRQGGKTFWDFAEDTGRDIVATHQTNLTKTAAGYRVIVVPESVMAMIRTAIAVFHTDTDGTVDTTATLVPSLRAGTAGGQAGFRGALTAALHVEGLHEADYTVSAHLLRKSLTTDLAWNPDLPAAANRRYVGQRVGSDVFSRIYTLDDPQHAPSRATAREIEAMIQTDLDGQIIVPSNGAPIFRPGTPQHLRREVVTAALWDAGWLRGSQGRADLLTTSQVAAELGLTTRQAKALLAKGALVSTTTTQRGVTRQLVSVGALEKYRQEREAFTHLQDLAAELGLTYHAAYALMRRLGLEPARVGATREIRILPDEADALRAEVTRLARLHQRSVRLSEAARILGVGYRTAAGLLYDGVLLQDPETDAQGARYVLRSSLPTARRPTTQAAGQADGLTVRQVEQLTGLSATDLALLVTRGHLTRQDGGSRTSRITLDSLRTWATGYRPTLLDQLPVDRDTQEETAAS